MCSAKHSRMTATSLGSAAQESSERAQVFLEKASRTTLEQLDQDIGIPPPTAID